MSTLLKPSVDAWIDQPIPAKNRSDTPKLRLHGPGSSAARRAFIFFGRPFPLGATVFSATLKLRLAGSWTGQTLTVTRVTQAWKEGRVNWNNQPSITTTNQASLAITGSAGDEVSINLTAMMGDVASGSVWHGLRLELGSDVERIVYSTDYSVAALRPKVDVDWRELPEAPDNLVPSGSQIVSLAKPVLSWQFAEKGSQAQQEQSSSQVQISATSDFSSPVYDSGKVANVESQWDLALTAYAGIGIGMFWRVRVWDDADLVSAWSDAAVVGRIAKGTLTIDNPSAGSPTVEETTPPIAWTLAPGGTGAVQSAYALWLYEVDAMALGRLVYEVPRNVSADASSTIPTTNARRPLIQSGKTYRVRLRVWDQYDRVGTIGDPPYYEATRDFTYVRSGVPAAVATLTAVADTNGGPNVLLTWTRSARPDYFSLREDGVEVADRIDPDDVFDSGTTYSMNWWRAESGVAHTYEIEAVVLDSGKLKHSDGNPTASATTNVKGKWLVDDDPSAELALQILDRAQADLSIGESATTYDVIGSRKPVRITDALRGYEGSISGILQTGAKRDAFQALKGRFKTLRFVQSTLNIPVILGETSLAPDSANRGDFWVMSAELLQVDEFFDADDAPVGLPGTFPSDLTIPASVLYPAG